MIIVLNSFAFGVEQSIGQRVLGTWEGCSKELLGSVEHRAFVNLGSIQLHFG